MNREKPHTPELVQPVIKQDASLLCQSLNRKDTLVKAEGRTQLVMVMAPKNKALQMVVDYNWLKMHHLYCLFMTVNMFNNNMLLYID
jgi:hypothetical protein